MEPTKMELQSTDLAQINIDALYQIAPSVFEEVHDTDGSVRLKLNFCRLRELLGDAIDTDTDDRYGFHWAGKQKAKIAAATPTRQTLRPIPEESTQWDNTQNIYIEGDNLNVLKLLQRAYLGKVKMIYIDPPYNTGNDFIYNDDFSISNQEYDLEAGDTDEEGNRYRKNMDSNARFHSDWCSMIYSRLLVARTLLANDGVIFISIDDNEVHNLRKICDEVFGASNFVAELVWERAFAPKNDAKYISNSHDYVVMYAKSLDNFDIGRLERTEKADARYKNPDNDPRGVWTSSDLSVKTYSAECDYPITTPFGRVIEPPAARCWSLSKKVFFERLQDNRIWFGSDGNGVPRIKRFLSELKFDGMAPTSILYHKEVGHSQEGAKEVVSIFQGKGHFDGPKPVRLLRRLLTLANTSPDSLILDFFSGSATTAHAVMQLNAEDGGKRKYICVQLQEETPENSEARKAGYNTIPEIAKERIRRAGKKIKETEGEKAKDLDTGFRVLRLDSSNMEDVYFSPNELRQNDLSILESNVKDDRSDLDLLFGCMIDWGVELSLPLRMETVDEKNLYLVNEGALVACFETDITQAVIDAMTAVRPLRVIFRDTCFTNDADKLNIYEQFKQRCAWSEEDVYRRIRVI